MRVRVCLSILVLCGAASGAGNLPIDDPRWDALRDAIGKLAIPDPQGGVQSMDEARVNLLLYGTPLPAGFWIAPDHRLTLETSLADEHDRPYSLPVRQRNLAGGVALSCEYQEGRPCGDGAVVFGELDSAAGYGTLLTLATRIGLAGGSIAGDTGFSLDRAYLKLDLDPFSVQIGRDVLVLGPSVRSALMLSANAVPQDGVRLRLRPVALPFLPEVKFSALYFIDRLRNPQIFHGTLLDLLGFQLDFWNRVSFGGSRALQLGGDGSPDYGGFGGFLLEHFGRTKEFTGVGTAENNRLSVNFAVRIPEWRSTRLYYEVAFEDTSNHYFNALRYDADHLFGAEVRALNAGPFRRLFLELEHTGYVSQEHSIFTSGYTNAGRTLADALGPDGTSLWIRTDLQIGSLQLSPWAEWLVFVADRYSAVVGQPVIVAAVGPREHRQRLGADVETFLGGGLQLRAGLYAERIGDTGFQGGATTLGAGLRAALTWAPP
ncbi:MAG TPA: capsule assembly Wzi family protein [Myxococcales bacterium]|jgi:hypothetical protein|nr:capsule assembly Wzi family protein [Myxococcales bacterium]